MGSSDYSLSVSSLVQKTSTAGDDSTLKLGAADITDFVARLPSNDYGIFVQNTLQEPNLFRKII